MAFGEGKAPVVAQAVEGPISPTVAASFLQNHANALVVLDDAAAAYLTRFKTPWLLGPVTEWDQPTIRKAVIWLAQAMKKPILKLTDEDYNESGLQDLVAAHGPAYDINVDVFRAMQETITGWPGGKPDPRKRPGDIRRRTDSIFPKRVLIFSPHPDDDVISMGGTLLRLVDQGHEVHVAYQTSGNIAVFDGDAIRFADFVSEFNRRFDVGEVGERLDRQVEEFVRNKKPGQFDSPMLLEIKGMIRRGEARAAARECGVPVERLHFMDLPFYETGTVRKKPLGEEDVRLTVELLRKSQAAPDLRRRRSVRSARHASRLPRGRHCGLASRSRPPTGFAPARSGFIAAPGRNGSPSESKWPSRSARRSCSASEARSSSTRARKTGPCFPGHDQREFWQRAEDRNRQTARLYDQLGLAEYEAIEGFVQWCPAEAAA